MQPAVRGMTWRMSKAPGNISLFSRAFLVALKTSSFGQTRSARCLRASNTPQKLKLMHVLEQAMKRNTRQSNATVQCKQLSKQFRLNFVECLPQKDYSKRLISAFRLRRGLLRYWLVCWLYMVKFPSPVEATNNGWCLTSMQVLWKTCLKLMACFDPNIS